MSLLAGAGRAFLARAMGAGLSFGVGLAVARALGPEGAGLYFLAVTAATIASVVGRLGLDHLVVRRTAAALEEGDHGRLRSTARQAILLATGISGLVAILVFLAAPTLERHVFELDGLAGTLRRTALGIVPLSLVVVFGELLRGLSRAGESQLVQVALPPAATLGFLALFVLIFGASPSMAAASYAAGVSTAAVLGALLWRRATPWLAGVEPSGRAAELAREATPFLGVAVLTLALPWISTLALALRGDEAGVGIFSVAYRTATLTSFVLVAVNAIAAPRFAALHARGDREALARSARQATLLMSLCALPILILAWAIPGTVMGLFGPRFATGARCLAILATGQFVNVVTGSVGALLMMSGHERALRKNLAGSVVLSLVLHAVLVPRQGIEGAALASAITLATMNVVSLLLVRHHLSITMLPLPLPRRSDA